MTIKKQRSLFNLFIGIFLLLFLIYLSFESYRFLSGPKITILSPENGAVINNPYVDFDSKITNATLITIDNRQIFTNNEGVFKDKLLLSPGYNIIVIEAQDKFKNKIREELELFRVIKDTDVIDYDDMEIATTTSETEEKIEPVDQDTKQEQKELIE